MIVGRVRLVRRARELAALDRDLRRVEREHTSPIRVGG